MYPRYDDIFSRIDEHPTWWSNGYPRYGVFAPNKVSIYASCVALVHAKCVCGVDYDQSIYALGGEDPQKLKDSIKSGTIGMGDPPNACEFLSGTECGSAATTCREIRVLEFWEKPNQTIGGNLNAIDILDWMTFSRKPEFERDLYDDFTEQWGLDID